MIKLGLLYAPLPAICLCLLPSLGHSQVAAASALPSPALVVVNKNSHTLSVIDPAGVRATATIPEGVTEDAHAHEVAVSADGRTAFAPIYSNAGVGKPGTDGHQMLVIDLATRKVRDHVDFGRGVRPHCVVYDPVSGLLYVTTELENSITIVDPQTLKVVGAIPTTQPESHMLAISHDGKRGYTANVHPGTVSVLDMAARKTIAVIPIAKTTQRISVSRDDSMVFTSDQTKPRLAVIDTVTDKIRKWVPLPGLGYGSASTKDGRYLLVAIPADNKVAVVDLKTLHVARTIDVPRAPQEILVRPDGKIAYVSCGEADQVAAIDLSTWKVQRLIPTGKSPDGLAWAR